MVHTVGEGVRSFIYRRQYCGGEGRVLAQLRCGNEGTDTHTHEVLLRERGIQLCSMSRQGNSGRVTGYSLPCTPATAVINCRTPRRPPCFMPQFQCGSSCMASV